MRIYIVICSMEFGPDYIISAFKNKDDAIKFVDKNYQNESKIYIHETILN